MAQSPLRLLLDLRAYSRSTASHFLSLNPLCTSSQILRVSLAFLLIQVSKKVYSTAVDTFLDELAVALVSPESGHEGSLGIGSVVDTHDFTDRIGGFGGMVEGDGGNEVVEDVCTDDVVEEVGVDKAEVTIDGCGSAAGEGPGVVPVVRKRGISVLQEGDCH